jgi:hypothetical protein
MQTQRIAAAVLVSVSGVLCAVSCVQSPGPLSQTEGPQTTKDEGDPGSAPAFVSGSPLASGGEALGVAEEPVGPGGGREPLTQAGKLCLFAVASLGAVGCREAGKICRDGGDAVIDVRGVSMPCWILDYVGCATAAGFSAIAAANLCARL